LVGRVFVSDKIGQAMLNLCQQTVLNNFRNKNLQIGLNPLLLQPETFLSFGFNQFLNRFCYAGTTNIREMNNYELMVIFTPVLSEEEFKAAQAKYASIVTDNGGEVLHTNPWGLKSLAYPIAKKTTGLYWVMEYKAPTSFNEKLKTQLLRDESVMRHMYTVLDKYAVEYNTRKRSGVHSATEKAEA
jgi:small subunit ribosomal protein S6